MATALPILPRLALGAISPTGLVEPAAWALCELLRRRGLQVQCFASQATLAGCRAAQGITGRAPRHLDSWLFTPDLCRELFTRGSSGSDFALVCGRFEPSSPITLGGTLSQLCQTLDLPRIGILDVATAGRELPPRPAELDGVILDGVSGASEAVRLQTMLETHWGTPVLGSLPLLDGLRRTVSIMAAGAAPDTELMAALAQSEATQLRLDRILELAGSRPIARVRPRLFQAQPRLGETVRIAAAHDEAFGCYFPDNLDLLEAHGFRVLDFSPLRDDKLPSDVQVVLVNCGQPENFADRLAANHCLHAALRRHVHDGGCIYAEGGGAAWLSQRLIDAQGRETPMVGLLPVTARNCLPCRASRQATGCRPTPVEACLPHDCWLGTPATPWRGYEAGLWEFTGPDQQPLGTLFGDQRVIGSRMHLHLAAQPELLRHLAQPRLAASPSVD